MRWWQIVRCGIVSLLALPAAALLLVGVGPASLALAQSPTAAQAPTAAPTQPAAPAPFNTDPVTASVRLFLNDILKFDPSSGFTADIYLGIVCDRECGDLGLIVNNGRATSREQLVDLPRAKASRMELALTDKIDLHHYPFDAHTLTIVLQSSRPGEQFSFVPDLEHTAVGDVRLQGWEVDDAWAATGQKMHAPHEFVERMIPTYRFSIEVHRPGLAGFFKVILPGLAILAVGSLGLIVGPEERIKRFDLFNAAFLGTVLFQLNVLSSLPPLSYLTFADRFLLINLVSIILGVVSSVAIILAFRSGKKAHAWALHEWSMVVIPLVWISVQCLNVLTVYVFDAYDPRTLLVLVADLAVVATVLVWYGRSMRLKPRFLAAYARSLKQTRSPKQALSHTLDIFASEAPLRSLTQEDLDALGEVFARLPRPTVLVDILVEAEQSGDTAVLKNRAALERFAAFVCSEVGALQPKVPGPVSAAA